MPIQGLTTDREAAFPRIGVLRKGDEKPEKGPGQDLTYFRFTSEDDSVSQAFTSAYGDEPTDINVFLPYATKDENFSAWREHWVAGGLKHRCDGQTCVTWQKQDGTYSNEPRDCPGGCKPVGRLSVIIPELTRLAFVTVQTTSLHDIMTLTDNLLALEMLRGDLRGIPLVLRRRPRKISTPSGKTRKRYEKWLLSLEAAPHWVALQLATQQADAVPRLANGSLPELVAPEDENSVVINGKTGEILDTGNGTDWESVPLEDAPSPRQEQPPDPVAAGGRAKAMLAAVNERTTGYYNSVPHMLDAIRLEKDDDSWNWPAPNDEPGWREAFNLAKANAH